MSRSNLNTRRLASLSRKRLIVTSLFMAGLLSGCGGGIFGTSDNNDMVDAASTTDTDLIENNQPEPGDNTPDVEPDTGVNAPTSNGSDQADNQTIIINFSNTTPSGLDPFSTTVPALKLINLTDVAIIAFTGDEQTDNQSVNAESQSTSELLNVNTGETQVSISVRESDVTIASISSLNAVEDSITTLIITTSATNTVNSDPAGELMVSALALDTRVVTSSSSLSEVRVVSTMATTANTAPPSFTLSPGEDNATGSELVLNNANQNNPSTGVYSVANAGNYILSPSDASFAAVPVSLEAGVIYTLVITENPESPVYVEVDSLTDTE